MRLASRNRFVDDSLRCSFCQKPQRAVGKLISSPGDSPRAYICDECISVCNAIVDDDHQADRPQPSEVAQLPSPAAETPVTRSDLVDFISKHKLGVLASISPEGVPQAALVGIAVTPELEIIFDTVATSRKYRNLLAESSASFVIGWEGEVTVQHEGEAHIPTGVELARYQEIYFTAWPDGPARMKWPGITYFVVHPTWIRYSDFNRTPPLIQEYSFGTRD